MARTVRNIALGCYVLLMIGYVTHVVGSGFFTIALVLITAVLVGQYLVAKMSPANRAAVQQAEVTRGAAIAEVPPEGSCLVYIYRERSAPALIVQTEIDNSTLTDLAGSTFTRWVVRPGSHVVRANIKGTNLTSKNEPGEAAFTLTQGESAFFQITTKMGITKYTVTISRDSNPEAARGKLSQMTLAASLNF